MSHAKNVLRVLASSVTWYSTCFKLLVCSLVSYTVNKKRHLPEPKTGHDKMRSGADLRGGSQLVNFDHVIYPHFVTFSSSLYTTISNPNPNPNTNHISNPNYKPNPNRNPTVITDPQIGPRDPQIVTVQICPADPISSAPHFVTFHQKLSVCSFAYQTGYTHVILTENYY